MKVGDVRVGEVKRNLTRKGFRPAQGTDHEKFLLYVDDKKTDRMVMYSHGAPVLARHEIQRNARNLGISAMDLFRVLNCEYDAAKTLSVLLSALDDEQT